MLILAKLLASCYRDLVTLDLKVFDDVCSLPENNGGAIIAGSPQQRDNFFVPGFMGLSHNVFGEFVLNFVPYTPEPDSKRHEPTLVVPKFPSMTTFRLENMDLVGWKIDPRSPPFNLRRLRVLSLRRCAGVGKVLHQLGSLFGESLRITTLELELYWSDWQQEDLDTFFKSFKGLESVYLLSDTGPAISLDSVLTHRSTLRRLIFHERHRRATLNQWITIDAEITASNLDKILTECSQLVELGICCTLVSSATIYNIGRCNYSPFFFFFFLLLTKLGSVLCRMPWPKARSHCYARCISETARA